MKTRYLEKLSSASGKIVRQLGQLADQQSVAVYLVGGTVRDLILGRKHSDLDFVVEGDAVDFAQKALKVVGEESAMKTHKAFGTASLVLKNGMVLDFASCRAESYEYPGALPAVRKGTILEDLFRRDFTINAMALQINSKAYSTLLDPFYGLQNLRKKTVRILHDQSFKDDSTRILRAIRFEQRFGFRMESRTLGLLRQRLASRTDDRVSVQRFFNEFKKMLMEADVVTCLRRCHQLRAEALLHPKFLLDLKCLATVQKNVPVALRKFSSYDASSVWKFFFMGIVERLSFEEREVFLRQLSLPARDYRTFLRTEAAIDFLSKLCQNALSPSGVFRLLKPLVEDECLYLYIRTDSSLVRKRLECFLKKDRFVQLEISGEDVKSERISGAAVGNILEKTLDYKIDHGFSSRQQELDYVKHLIARL